MSHLTREQRYTICTMLQNGYPQSEIARVINKNKSVVSREIRRNADARSGQYRDDLAHRKYLKRQAYKAKPCPSGYVCQPGYVDKMSKEWHWLAGCVIPP